MEDPVGVRRDDRMDRVLEVDEERAEVRRDGDLAGLAEQGDPFGMPPEGLQGGDRIVSEPAFGIFAIEHGERERRGHECQQVERIRRADGQIESKPGVGSECVEEELASFRLEQRQASCRRRPSRMSVRISLAFAQR
jgi:hypothetical protein